jgi:DNA-binding transcriptional ArsR family regulator
VEEALRALAEPRRRRILELVRDEELTAGRIAEQFEISRPAVSQHLRVLEDAGLVSVRPDGTRRLYRARPEGLEDLKEFLDGFWGSSLFRLKHVVERDERRRRRGR